MADMKLIRDMAAAMSASPAKPAPYDTVAEVVRVDGDTAWVHIPGGVDETPVQMSISARSGDQVRIRVAGGQAWVVGNNTSPPTDDKKAEEAQETADEALLRVNTLEAVNVVAEMIETGTISADYIQGGKLTLGGTDDKDGFLENLDKNGNHILYINNNGLVCVKDAEFDGKEYGVYDSNMGYFPATMHIGNYFPWTSTSASRVLGLGISAERAYEVSPGYFSTEEDTLFELFADVSKNSNDSAIKTYFRDSLDLYTTGVGDPTTSTHILDIDSNGITMASGKTINGVDVGSLANSVSTINMASTTAVASDSNTTLCNTGSLSPGTYILNAMAIFPEQSGGYRRLFFSTTNTGSATTRFARTNVAPVSGADTEVQLTSMFTVSSATTYYLRAYQNSGSSISVATAGIQILKIHA